MIATILPSSTSFHAVGYNERKVAKGVAHLLEMKNFGAVEMLTRHTANDLVSYLQNYSSRNPRIRKAQFHVAVSCRGHEKTEEELLAFAHEYMKEMGYGDPGQPMLVYAHTDTANTHLHIITSRIAPDGRKIDHNHERVRSQKVIDKLLGNDNKAKVKEDLAEAMSYKFSSITQFKSLMNSLGYECYEKNGTVSIKRSGTVLMRIPLAEISERYESRTFDKNRRRQLRAIFRKYRDSSADRAELTAELKRKFGIDLVFFGKSDSPYGYMIIDHNTKSVMNGGKILPIGELLDFATVDERFARIDSFIDTLLADNPRMSIVELNDRLSSKYHAYVKGGRIWRNNESRPIRTFMWETLKMNNRIAWVESFHPSTEAERDFLCRIGKVTAVDKVRLSDERYNTYHNRLSDLRQIFSTDDTFIPGSRFSEEGFRIRDICGEHYAVDFHSKILINLDAEGFDTRRLRYRKPETVRKNDKDKAIAGRISRLRPLKDAGVGHGEKREWEVGYRGDYDRIDDENNMKR